MKTLPFDLDELSLSGRRVGPKCMVYLLAHLQQVCHIARRSIHVLDDRTFTMQLWSFDINRYGVPFDMKISIQVSELGISIFYPSGQPSFYEYGQMTLIGTVVATIMNVLMKGE